MFGIDQFTAILNPPQAAIVAVGRVAKRAVVAADGSRRGATGDHAHPDRGSPGVGWARAAAQFLATLQRVLEHPGLLME